MKVKQTQKHLNGGEERRRQDKRRTAMGFMLEKYEVVYSLRIAEFSHYLLCESFAYPIHHRTSLLDSIFTVN